MGLVLGVQSHQVVCHVSRWGKPRETVHCALDAQGAWDVAVQAYLGRFASHKAVTLYVGAPHVQWLLETWPPHLHKRQDFLAYLTYQAAQILSGSKHVDTWQVGLDARARVGDTLPIAVLDQRLLQTMTALVQEFGMKLTSVQPLLQASWMQVKKTNPVQMTQGVWAFEEQDWLTMFGVRAGQLHSVRSVRLNALNPNVPALTQHYAQSMGALPSDVQCVAVGL